ncbi:HAD family hydrolase [Nocardiopsis algeriensis]|uniref:Phosphoglycolate phosphatase-like HAD superfamily hydrolase n=1 Tax=Nocardiopsis algeriensis TaxID=1478215 RepID=A0A841IIZ6_9ACTN|nr:haloacid dehalogenase-like hydrolase [Nocardiopsis algeriensis]MBB6118739.1 phosphoglycolate phosphatase-like HAD superfamily hydrolase [Nocardiopsis algeriensis]
MGWSAQRRPEESVISRLVLWNIDLTLLDAGQVMRAAYAEAFEKVTGEPLVYLTSAAGRTDSEMFFEFCARNYVDTEPDTGTLSRFLSELETAFAARGDELLSKGRAMPGAQASLAAVASLPDTVQTVVSGSTRATATTKLAAFGLDSYLDLEIGGYGSVNYPKSTLIQSIRLHAKGEGGGMYTEEETVLFTDNAPDVRAALIGGAVPVGVLNGPATEGQLRDAGVRTVLPDLTDPGAVRTAVHQATGR